MPDCGFCYLALDGTKGPFGAKIDLHLRTTQCNCMSDGSFIIQKTNKDNFVRIFGNLYKSTCSPNYPAALVLQGDYYSNFLCHFTMVDILCLYVNIFPTF